MKRNSLLILQRDMSHAFKTIYISIYMGSGFYVDSPCIYIVAVSFHATLTSSNTYKPTVLSLHYHYINTMATHHQHSN